MKGFKEGVFSRCGASHASPTEERAITTISECRRNTEQMMGSQGAAMIEHHYSEMMKLVDRL